MKGEEKASGKMKETLGIRISSRYVKAIDELIRKGVYASRGEIVREGLRKIFISSG